MAHLGYYGDMALKHLKEFRPSLHKELKESGELMKYLLRMEHLAAEEIANLMSHGLQRIQAEEIVLPMYILTEPEPMPEKEQTVSKRSEEFYNLFRDILQAQRDLDNDEDPPLPPPPRKTT